MREKNIKKRLANDLVHYRERFGFTQRQVAELLGERHTTLLSKLEQGVRLPTLLVALKLAVIYRAPVDFLYSEIYSNLKAKIRAKEESREEPNAS